MKTYAYLQNKKTLQVTRTPDFVLKLKGRFDGKTEGVAETFIEKLLKRESAIETDEVITAEDYLKDIRKKAHISIKAIEKARNELSLLPKPNNSTDMTEIRETRKAEAKRASYQGTISENLFFLTEYAEDLITVETILAERIQKSRNLTLSKIQAYLIGVLKADSEFEHEISFSDNAYEIYKTKHFALDKAIDDIVNKEVQSNED